MKNTFQRKNNQGMRWMFIGFGFLMLLFVSSKDSALPRDWSGRKPLAQTDLLTSTGGYPDTNDAGTAAAKEDIKTGKPKFMLYGLFTPEVLKNLKNDKVEYVLGGCVLGGPGYSFWKGYNEEVIRQGLGP